MDDDLSILISGLLVLFLVLVNGFFMASSYALVKVRESRLNDLVLSGSKRGAIAQHITSRIESYLLTCQLGMALAALALGWVGGVAIAPWLTPLIQQFAIPEFWIEPISIVIAFAIITFLHVVVGVLAPQSIALHNAEGASLWLSGPLFLFHKLMYPATWLLNAAAHKWTSLMGIRLDHNNDSGHTEEEIRILMKESQQNGHIDEDELALVENVFNFSERVAREIMVPRTMFICLYANATFVENLEIVKKERHSRYPVADGDKDHIIGWVHASDVYNEALSKGPDGVDYQDIVSFIRPMSVVPESMEISQVLKTMQQERIQMVAVVDEYGGTSGLITLEDIIEEIVGDIQDEIREERAEVEVLRDRTSVDARMLLQEVNDLFRVEIEDEEVDTIGGWIYSQLDETPSVGQQVIWRDMEFKITEVEHLRIERVEVNQLPWKDEQVNIHNIEDAEHHKAVS